VGSMGIRFSCLSPIAVSIELTEGEREQLESWSGRRSTAQALALRSRIVLATTEGASSSRVARDLGVSVATVRKWRNRFAAA
jgi:FixJ family two-component response regulator